MCYAPSRLLPLLLATALLLAAAQRPAHSSIGSSSSSSEGTTRGRNMSGNEEKPLLSIQLSTSVNDVIHDYGLIQNRVNPFAEDPTLKAPPKTKWEDGAMNLGMLRALYTEGQYIVFVGNTTGNI